ncbi:MAG TPA: hypothetical protein VG028_15920 [Terriglobia bacterium]|nr:hypothetical protein [Terriglobia bacterium]
MTKIGRTKNHHDESREQPHRVRLPGFLIEGEIGMGDAIKRVTYAIGIKPCGGCEKRAAALNRWMQFSR